VVEEEGEGRPCLLTRTIATIGRPISTEQTDEFSEKMIFFPSGLPWLQESDGEVSPQYFLHRLSHGTVDGIVMF